MVELVDVAGKGEKAGRENQNRPSWQRRAAATHQWPRCKLLGANGPTGTGHLAHRASFGGTGP